MDAFAEFDEQIAAEIDAAWSEHESGEDD